MKLSDRVIEQERIGLKYTELIAEIQALEAERDKYKASCVANDNLQYKLHLEIVETKKNHDIWKKACELLIVALSQKNIYNIPSKEQYKLEYWYEKAKLKLESKNAD